MKGKPDIKNPKIKKKRYPTELLIAAGICLFTFLCFWNTLSNQFLYWDDNVFILNNVNIRRINWINIKYLFSHEFGANWQPLTMLSYSLNYYFSKYSPGGYFFTNVLIHTINTGLVFFVIKKLILLLPRPIQQPVPNLVRDSTSNNLSRIQFGIQHSEWFIPGMVSLWFGIHPMHVESVSWLFERKDVLYTLFYLSGLLVYLEHIKRKQTKWLALVFLLFAFSCMSKPMAVVFPFSLLLIDFFMNRKFTTNVIMEKLPFLIASLIMGLYTIHTQKEAHAFSYTFSLADRFFIASYSFLAYIGKLFLPIHLSGFYPYPMNPGEKIPRMFYFAPIGVLLLTILPMYYAYRRNKSLFKILVFGFGFYLVNIALVIQFFSVGSAIISDRYSYISYIGLFFMLAYFISQLLVKSSTVMKNAIVSIVILFSLGLAYMCYERTEAWANTETMLSDVIYKYPEQVPQAYKYLGIYYGKNNRPADAFKCYDVLINKMHLRDADAYCNMGAVYMSQGNDSMAMKYFTASLQIDSNAFMPYNNMGYICAKRGDFGNAFNYFDKANKIFPNDEGLYFNVANAHLAAKKYADAVNDYNFLIRINPDNSLYYFNRGVVEYSMNNKEAATSDFIKTLSMRPLQGNEKLNASAAYNLSIIYKEKGDAQKASFYAAEAQRLGNP